MPVPRDEHGNVIYGPLGTPADRERSVSEQERDEQGKFAKSDYEPMNDLLRRRGLFRARIGEKASPDTSAFGRRSEGPARAVARRVCRDENERLC